MFTGGTYVSQGPPLWAIIAGAPVAVLILIAAVGLLGGPPPAGRKIRCWKRDGDRMVRDYDAERRLRNTK